MEYLTYIEIKRLTNIIITRAIKEINSRYEKKSIDEFVKKYGCKNEREFLQLVCCEVESLDLNISIRETIKNLENESYSIHNDLDVKISKLNESEEYNKYLKEQLIFMSEKTELSKQQIKYLQNYIDDMELVLRHNNISFKKEIKNIKPNSTPPKRPSL